VTPKTILEQSVQEAIETNPALARQINAMIQFHIAGPEGGDWYLDFTRDTDCVRTGVTAGAQMTIAISDHDFVDVVLGRTSPQSAFVRGRIKVKPMNVVLVLRITKVLALGREVLGL
jgi:putative sterol carrier protein